VKSFSGISKVQKLPISTHLEALNFDSCEFLPFLRANMHQNHNFGALKTAKVTFVEL